MKTKLNFGILLVGLILVTLTSCEKTELTPQPENLDSYLDNRSLKSATECNSTSGQINWGSYGNVAGEAGSYTTAVTFNNKAYVFYKGKNTNKIYYTTNIGLSNEREWNIGTGETKEEPAVAVHNGKLYVAYKGKSTNKIYYKYSTYVNSSTGQIYWSSETSLSDPRTSKGPTMCSFNGKLYFFYKGESSKSIYYCTLDNHTSDIKIPNGRETNFAPTATAAGSYIYLLYKGSTANRSLYMSRGYGSGGTLSWLPEQRYTDSYEKNVSCGISYIKDKVFFTTVASDKSIAYRAGLYGSFNQYNTVNIPYNIEGVSEIVLEPNLNCTSVIVFYKKQDGGRVCYYRGNLVMND